MTYARVADLPDTEVCPVVESRRRSDALRELVRILRDHPDPNAVGLKYPVSRPA